MVCYSADGRSGFLDKEGIARIKSGLAKNIFRQELTEIYRQQTQRRDELVRQSGEVMKELIRQMLSGTLENPRIEQLMGELAQRLKSTSGKKQYGYLKASLKAVVDEIVDELATTVSFLRLSFLWGPPLVILLVQEQEADSAAQEVQDAGSLHADGEEGEQHRQDHQQHSRPIRQRQDRE